jgi:hypothetical protein
MVEDNGERRIIANGRINLPQPATEGQMPVMFGLGGSF